VGCIILNNDSTANRREKFQKYFRKYREYVFIGFLIIAIYFTSFYDNFLLFHNIIEMIGIMITFTIFIVFWNSRKAIDNQFFTLLGISFLFMGVIDLLHTLAYKNMNIFLGYDANLPTQLWIAGRAFQAVALLLSVLFIGKKLNTSHVWVVLAVVTSALLTLAFTGYFPDCYIEGSGLTTFKIVSEFVICLVYASSIVALFFKRSSFGSKIFYFICIAISFSILGEIFFSLYFDVTGTFNILGHLARFISLYFFYRATVHVGLKDPLELLFQNLQSQHSQRLHSLIENIPEGIVLLDEEYKVIIKNSAATKFLPYLVKGKKINKVQNISDYSIEDILNPPSSDLTFYEIHVDSPDARVFNVGGVKITQGAQKGDSILVIHDVTSQNKIRERVQTQEKLASVGKLARGISHDFKNIIWTISGAAELIESQSKDEALRDLGNMILEQSAKGNELINQILDFSGQSKAKDEVLDLKPVIEETVRFASSSLPVNVSVNTTIEDFKIKINKTQFQQILLNLIVNSKDALKKGGKIQISTQLVCSSKIKDFESTSMSLPVSNFVNIRVLDDGEGIDKKDINKVFEPFFTTKSTEEGSGLGLSQVYGLIRQHNGYINIDSTKGEFTQVDIFFPLYEN
jgi:signal transduction histidine kinase